MTDKRQWLSLADLKKTLNPTDEPEHSGDEALPAKGQVYSTEHGRLCPDCGHPVKQCQCKAQARAAPKPGGKVQIRRETKGRKGKGVTVIEGLPLDQTELEQLAKALRQHCGVGGTCHPGLIELQGEQQAKAKAFLQQRGLMK
ncbi:MAG: stress response translation initiation inhibitor YciH [Hahellaceae bacterium]|jgi:translation initiation factor 1|nr:stress response translation initiation inhibitor YciH [Hahellaceae bacterium]